jgi:hypothetical protein
MVMVGSENVFKYLISLDFSWTKIRNLPVSFRMVPRPPPAQISRPMPASRQGTNPLAGGRGFRGLRFVGSAGEVVIDQG